MDGNESIGQSQKATSPDRGPAPTDLRSDSDLVGLKDELEAESIHPVLIFGTTGSGKTTMLQSLLRYARVDPDARISPDLGRNILRSPASQDRYEFAQIFFRRALPEFVAGKAAAPTELLAEQGNPQPLFIPIDLKIRPRKHVEEDLKFILVDGMGEWYEKEANRVGLKPLPREIRYLLEQFSKPISVIFVAPCVMVGPSGIRDEALRDYSHECLEYTMEQYESLRTHITLDNVLLLYTKWDALFRPGARDGIFYGADPEVFYDTVGRWPYALPKFTGMANLRNDAKSIMPYSAAWMADDHTIIDPGDHAPVFNMFNRTLWNWLYGNAPAAGRGLKPAPGRPTLYDDVAPKARGHKLGYQSLAEILLWLR